MSFNKKDPELIRTIILDHYENPQYHIDDNSINTLKNYFSCNVCCFYYASIRHSKE